MKQGKWKRHATAYCRMRGAVAVSADVGGITIDAGEDVLTVYRFNTGAAQHYFCSKCGIYTHHRRRSNPNECGVDVACLKDVSQFDFEDVPVIDGINHPSDQGRGYEIVGHLRFIRAEDRPTLAAAWPSGLMVTQTGPDPAWRTPCRFRTS